jgi:hypothetical protein
MRRGILFLVLVFLIMMSLDPALGALALPLFAMAPRRLHTDIQAGLDALVDKFVVANNRPPVDVDLIKQTGHLSPIACIEASDSNACEEARSKRCVNPDTHLELVTRLQDISGIYAAIRANCSSKVITDIELKENVHHYLELVRTRLLAKGTGDPVYNNFVKELKMVGPGVAPDRAENFNMLLCGMQRAFLAIRLATEKRIVACAEMAGLAYLELLAFQRKMKAGFTIHRVEINALKEDDTPFNHVFLILNAPDHLKGGQYRAEKNKAGRLI